MRTIRIGLAAAALCGVALPAGRVDAAVTAAPGYAVRSIPTPGKVQGGVVRQGADIFVGQGPTFTGGAQSVIRFTEGGSATTIASGFNSLGGFDIAADGTLYVVDNGLEASGATSGDTLYAIPDAPTRTSALASSAAEVLPSGSIDFASDALVVPGAVLVSDSVGPGAGKVVRVAGGTSTDLITGLDYAAGLARDGSTLLVGNRRRQLRRLGREVRSEEGNVRRDARRRPVGNLRRGRRRRRPGAGQRRVHQRLLEQHGGRRRLERHGHRAGARLRLVGRDVLRPGSQRDARPRLRGTADHGHLPRP